MELLCDKALLFFKKTLTTYIIYSIRGGEVSQQFYLPTQKICFPNALAIVAAKMTNNLAKKCRHPILRQLKKRSYQIRFEYMKATNMLFLIKKRKRPIFMLYQFYCTRPLIYLSKLLRKLNKNNLINFY